MAGPKVPTDLSGRQVRAALERAGLLFDRQRGSHMIMYRESPHRVVVVPAHQRVRVGTLRKIIHDAGLTVEQFLELL